MPDFSTLIPATLSTAPIVAFGTAVMPWLLGAMALGLIFGLVRRV